jgi:hypothetical protein
MMVRLLLRGAKRRSNLVLEQGIATLPPAELWLACAKASAKASGQVARNDEKGEAPQ